MSQPQCTVCFRPSQTAMCDHCWSELATDLRRTDWYEAELTTVLMKNTQYGSGNAGYVTGTAVQPLVFSTGASEAMTVLRDRLASWVAMLWEDCAIKQWVECYWCGAWHADQNRQHDPVGKDDKTKKPLHCAGMWTDRTATLDVPFAATECAKWLLRHKSWSATHAAAGDFHEELTTAYARAWRVIDLPADRFYAGQCDTTITGLDGGDRECATHLWASYSRATVKCPNCLEEHDVTTRRNAMLRAVENQHVTATEASRLLAKFSIEIPSSTIRAYAQTLANKGKPIPARIAAVGKNERGYPLYRVGDVLDVFFRQHATRAA